MCAGNTTGFASTLLARMELTWTPQIADMYIKTHRTSICAKSNRPKRKERSGRGMSYVKHSSFVQKQSRLRVMLRDTSGGSVAHSSWTAQRTSAHRATVLRLATPTDYETSNNSVHAHSLRAFALVAASSPPLSNSSRLRLLGVDQHVGHTRKELVPAESIKSVMDDCAVWLRGCQQLDFLLPLPRNISKSCPLTVFSP